LPYSFSGKREKTEKNRGWAVILSRLSKYFLHRKNPLKVDFGMQIQIISKKYL
jgi:hypothetical protein